MISRRNIRVKVMQTLYTLSTLDTEEQHNKATGSNLLNEKLAKAVDLFTISLLYIFHSAQYSEMDAIQRSSKYLPTDADKNVNIKIAGNDFLWQVMNNATFTEKVKDVKLERFVDAEWIKKIYQQLEQSEEYIAYIAAQERNPKSDRAILQHLWTKHILENEALQEFFTDELPGWEDDKEMIVMLMDNFFKSNSKVNFLNMISPEKREYAHALLHTTLEKEAYCLELIQPRLKNWDADRVAYIDILLLRMGVCEFLFFPTIPSKVTINEYIEVAKMYSTPQSGQFVNGVLDNILKDLVKEDRVTKQQHIRK